MSENQGAIKDYEGHGKRTQVLTWISSHRSKLTQFKFKRASSAGRRSRHRKAGSRTPCASYGGTHQGDLQSNLAPPKRSSLLQLPAHRSEEQNMLNDALKMHSIKSKFCESLQEKQLCFFNSNKNWRKMWRGTYRSKETLEIINRSRCIKLVWTLSRKVNHRIQ